MTADPAALRALAEREKKLQAFRHLLVQIEAADEACRQVILAADPSMTSDVREVRECGSQGRDLMRVAQKFMVVAIYDEERRLRARAAREDQP